MFGKSDVGSASRDTGFCFRRCIPLIRSIELLPLTGFLAAYARGISKVYLPDPTSKAARPPAMPAGRTPSDLAAGRPLSLIAAMSLVGRETSAEVFGGSSIS